MKKMDPEFAAAFSSEYPEAYSEALKTNREKSASEAAMDLHIPVVPPFLTRFVAGVIVMLFLLAGFQIVSEFSKEGQLSIPSGKVLNSSFSQGVSMDPLEELAKGPSKTEKLDDTIAPINRAGNQFFKGD